MSRAASALRRPAALLLAVGLLLGSAACAGESRDESGDEGEATILEPRNEGNPEESEDGESTTTEPEVVPLIGGDTPQAALEQFYGAWKSGDRDNASVVGLPEAIDGIFAAPDGDYALYQQCDSGEFDTTGCMYRGDFGTIQFELERRDERWIVVTATFSPA